MFQCFASIISCWYSNASSALLINIIGNNGYASFSIIGTSEVGQTLSISEDSADPDCHANRTAARHGHNGKIYRTAPTE